MAKHIMHEVSKKISVPPKPTQPQVPDSGGLSPRYFQPEAWRNDLKPGPGGLHKDSSPSSQNVNIDSHCPGPTIFSGSHDTGSPKVTLLFPR